MISPESGARDPSSSFMIVLFPAPLRPRRQTRSPRSMAKRAWSRTGGPPNAMLTSCMPSNAMQENLSGLLGAQADRATEGAHGDVRIAVSEPDPDRATARAGPCRARFREAVLDGAADRRQIECATDAARQQQVDRSVVVGELEQRVGGWRAEHADVAGDGREASTAHVGGGDVQRAGDGGEVGVRDGAAQGQVPVARPGADPGGSDIKVDVPVHRLRLDGRRRAGEADGAGHRVEPSRDIGARDARARALRRDPAGAWQVDDELRWTGI